jgi:hypothetical protein
LAFFATTLLVPLLGVPVLNVVSVSIMAILGVRNLVGSAFNKLDDKQKAIDKLNQAVNDVTAKLREEIVKLEPKIRSAMEQIRPRT